MKLTKTIITAAFASMFVFSCTDDMLDERPVDSVVIIPGEQVITNESDMQLVVNGMYSELAIKGAFGAKIIAIGDIISDNVFLSNANSGYYRTTQLMSWSSPSNDFEHWNDLYDAIALANMIVNSDLEETDAVIKMKSNAYAVRALSFFYLVNTYAANPTSGQHQELGVPVYTGDYDPNGLYPRATVEEVYNQIISDLNASLTPQFETPDNKGYLSATAARMLLSKVYLTRGQAGDNALAKSFAEQAVSNAPGSFSLIGNDEETYFNYFASTNSAESQGQAETVWEVNMTGASNPGVNEALGSHYSYSADASTKADFLVRQSLYNSYADTDIRKALFDTENVPVADNPRGVWTLKYPSNADGVRWANNIKVMRLTEALFLKWEAMAKLGEGAQALTELNAFVTARGGTPYTGSDYLTIVLDEKQKEFVAEGLRFFDLRRNNLPIAKGTNCDGASCLTAANSTILTFPIPLSSLNLNPNMIQNPGYNQ